MPVEIQFTYRNEHVSESLKNLTQEKFDKLYKLVPDITKIHVTFSLDHLDHVVEAQVHAPHLGVLHAKAKSPHMSKNVDSLFQKLRQQILVKKSKHQDHG